MNELNKIRQELSDNINIHHKAHKIISGKYNLREYDIIIIGAFFKKNAQESLTLAQQKDVSNKLVKDLQVY